MNAPRTIGLQLHAGRVNGMRQWIFAYGAELRLPLPLVDCVPVRELLVYILMPAQSQDTKT
jgi:hypothetical protein